MVRTKQSNRGELAFTVAVHQNLTRCRQAMACFGPCYQWPYVRCCIIAGDIEGGGLARLLPVLGLTIGIAFRGRKAEGWRIFM